MVELGPKLGSRSKLSASVGHLRDNFGAAGFAWVTFRNVWRVISGNLVLIVAIELYRAARFAE